MKTRRQILAALSVAALAAPLASFAQPRKVWRIGLLLESESSFYIPRLDAFKSGMRALGYVEGRDYITEARSAQSDFSRLPKLMMDLISQQVDLIVTTGTPSGLAASKATREIPILITTVGDPVGSGFAASLARPGGNVTGFTQLSSELISKHLDLLRQLLPQIRRVAFLYDPNNQSNVLLLAKFEADCNKLQIQPIRAPARNAEEIKVSLATLVQHKAQGLIVSPSSINTVSRSSVVEHTIKHRLPAVFSVNIYAVEGGLISYSADFDDLYRRAAAYADKIFKGAKPGDLPIQQPTTFDFVLNLKTAKALGLTIPQSILVQANKVIE